MQLKINDSRIKPEMIKPGTSGSAAIDLFACISSPIRILVNETVKVSSGVSIFLNDETKVGMVYPRSGLGSRGIVLGNLTGVIDSDYQGDITLVLWNRSKTIFDLNPMERVAQLVVLPIYAPKFEIVDSFSQVTERGEAGFGSTGQ